MNFSLLRVNMTTLECRFEAMPDGYAGLGGRALTSALVAAEVDPACHPLGPRNKLVFAPGLLGGTNCANTGRLSVGCKSPLTGGIKEANAGGEAGGLLARLGLRAVVLEGQAERGLHQLELGLGWARLSPAEAAGLNNYAAVELLRSGHGDARAYISIGRAGEFRLSAASVALTDRELRPSRHAGRGGAGAVMGAKGLKSIIIRDEGETVPPQNPADFENASLRFAESVRAHPVSGRGLARYGTAALMNIMHEAGALPTRNFRAGRFEGHERVSGENLRRLTLERGGESLAARGCMEGCLVNCGGIFPDRNGRYVSKWPEYETIWAFGPNLGISDLDQIARYDRLCDDLGVDTLDVGSALALLMEAGVLPFGQAEAALRLVEEIGEGSPLGRILGCGAAVTGRVYGLHRVPTVKGQSLPAYDPRAVKGQGVTYATTPMGADHTAGYAVAANILNLGGEVDPLDKAGQAELSRRTQIESALLDSLGLCFFAGFAALEREDAFGFLAEMFSARYGLPFGPEDLRGLGRRVLETELDFNRRAGFGAAADRLPDFFSEESLDPHATRFDLSGSELDEVLKF